jgi:hypothetical protein
VFRPKYKFDLRLIYRERISDANLDLGVVIDKNVVPFRGRLLFCQYIPGKSHKCGVKLYKLCLPGGLYIRMVSKYIQVKMKILQLKDILMI